MCYAANHTIIISHQLQLLSSILIYIIVNIILFKSAACTGSDLACFYQLPCGSCAKYFLFPMFLNFKTLKFSVPANTTSDGKLFQMLMTQLVKDFCLY